MLDHSIVLLLDNIRSLYNVGAIFRIADGAGVEKMLLTGMTGYPQAPQDARKPWEIDRVAKQITKTALGAENTVPWEYHPTSSSIISEYKANGFTVVALEKNQHSQNIFETSVTYPILLIVGHERAGVNADAINVADHTLHIPMYGEKKSLNVSTATAVAVYELRRIQTKI